MKTNHLVFLLLFMLGQPAASQGSLTFLHLSVEDGLSQGQATFIMKDSRGFVWVGTQDGLNRFDGYSFRHFFKEENNPQSLSANYVWCMLEDSADNIWIGTFGGELCRYDRERETFERFAFESFTQSDMAGNSVRSLMEYPPGRLWIGADKGLWSLDMDSQSLEKLDFYLPEGRELMAENKELLNIIALLPLTENSLLVGAKQGLFKVDMGTGKISPLTMDGQALPIVNDIVPAAALGHFWVATSKGLYELEYQSTTGEAILEKELTFEANAPKRFIHSIFLDRNEVLWLGTNEGISRFSNGQYDEFSHQPKVPTSLSNNLVYDILEVEPGLMWAGTRTGINIFSNEKPAFGKINTEATGGEFCFDASLGLLHDQSDNLWVGTRQGLIRIGHFSEGEMAWEFECMNPENTLSMPHDYVLNLYEDNNGELWSTFRRNGFARLKKGPKGKWVFERINYFDDQLGSMGMNILHFDQKGKTWLGTPGAGLIKWESTTNEHQVFVADSTDYSLKHGYIFSLFEDSRGRFWVGSANGGICKMDKEAGTFECHVFDERDGRSLSSNMVLSMTEDSSGRLWVCTANGLNLMEEEGQFRRFFKKDGLPNNVVYGLLEESENQFWVSTNKGISKVTFDNGKFETQNFSAASGLAGEEFNQYSFLKTGNGQMLFGGTYGLTIFHPKDIKPYPHAPPIALTDFQLFNRSISAGGEGDFVLEKSINEISEITLQHHQNFIALEFAALGFTKPEKNKYAYQLVGLDEEWVASEGRRFASYPNLSPGKYEFRVKAANHDGVWNKDFKSLKIRVLKPWWATWWAYVLYVATVSGLVFVYVRFRENSIREIEQAKAQERELFRKRTARDFHDEAGNRITKLSLLTEVAKRRPEADTSLLVQVEENIQALRTGMRDFIWVLDPENDNLQDTLLRLKDFGNGLFEHSSVRFRTEKFGKEWSQFSLSGNARRHILLIFKEAMNNCVKYSGAEEAVLSVHRQAGCFSIVFSDNGKGFDPRKAPGNGLRNMRERAKKMEASLNISSNGKEGTVISLEFKTTQMGN